MKLNTILIIFLFGLISLSINAQNRDRRGGFDIEAIRKEKAEFLKKEMDLTDAEAKVFLPLEAEFVSKKFETNRDARRETKALKKKENKTEADYKRIVQLNLESEQKEAQLQLEYYKKFSEVLSAQKVEKYRTADMKFKEMMLKRRRN
ncbi:MAG: hypothetical protein QM660_01285 [Dysgonomonas sp.]